MEQDFEIPNGCWAKKRVFGLMCLRNQLLKVLENTELQSCLGFGVGIVMMEYAKRTLVRLRFARCLARAEMSLARTAPDVVQFALDGYGAFIQEVSHATQA